MTASEQVLISLIKKSLFNKTDIIPAEINWDEVMREAELQSVTALAAAALPDNVKKEKQDALYENSASFFRILYAQNEIISLLSESKIPTAVLKGSAAAVYYPDPSLRTMGDIDLLVPPERFDEGVRCLLKGGYKPKGKKTDNHDRHITFSKDGVVFELHHRFSSTGIDIEPYINNDIDKLITAQIDEYSFPMLPTVSNGMVLLAHMGSHLRHGLGLRQVIDFMMYVDKVLSDDIWEKQFKEAAKKTGLFKLAVTVARMCQLYFGLDEGILWPQEADKALCERLIKSLLSSGNFGRKQGEGNKVQTVKTEILRNGLFKYLQHAGEYNWKYYKNHHWVKPFCAFYQAFRYGVQGIKARRGESILNDLNKGAERYELLKDLDLV